ncbi:MAG TPA: serine/threonine-protein kinase, partial [Kofleriaceae bacterium]
MHALPEAERHAIADHASSCDACRAVLAMEETAAGSQQIAAQPDQIGRYRIEKRLGAGAMGVVYSAYDAELDRRIAVKLMRPQASADRLRREAQTLAKLSHSNIVAVHDVGTHDGAAFVAMALVDGENLRAWLATPRSTDQILDKLVQATRGIVAAHAAGVIHRDLKPDNIFVSTRGEVLVGDFGLARSSGPPSGEITTPELTQTGAIMGTPVYMAPEAFAGETAAAGDQFSLCVTMWEALYGSRPFNGATVDELLRAIKAGPPTPPKKVPIHDAIVRGLAVAPTDRWPSVAALLAAITRRKRRWPYVAAALALLAAAGTAFATTRPDPKLRMIAACDAKRDAAFNWTPARHVLTTADLVRRHGDVGKRIAVLANCYAERWISTAREGCRANASTPDHDAFGHCLERRARMFDIAVSTLDHAILPIDARTLLDTVGTPESCSGVVAGAPATPELLALQQDIDLRKVFMDSNGPIQPGLLELVTRATALGDLHTRAEAEAVVSHTLLAHAQIGDAEPHMRSALALADQSHDDRLRAEIGSKLASILARSGRTVEAKLVRDNAASAAARANDPVSLLAVEEANGAILRHELVDPKELVPVYRKIIALGEGVCGTTAIADQYRVQLALSLQLTNDPSAPAELAHAREILASYGDSNEPPEVTLARLALTEPDRTRRIA